MRRIGDPTAASVIERDALVMKLMFATSMPVKWRPRVSASSVIQRLGSDGHIEIIVLDVGQASAALIKRNGKPIGFFDVGAPIWFNKGSFDKNTTLPIVPNGFIILSHWDFDHFDLGRRHKPYHNLDWFAPDQPVGPNVARFQADLGAHLTFIDGSASFGGFSLSRGTSTTPTDRNGSGYQLRYEKDGRSVLLTGDTGYDLIQPHMLSGIGGLTVPHHAARSDASPPASIAPDRAIASYGDPNSYRHPHKQTITSHHTQGWKVSATAPTPGIPRGNRRLFP